MDEMKVGWRDVLVPQTASPRLSTHPVISDDDRLLPVFSEAFTAVVLI